MSARATLNVRRLENRPEELDRAAEVLIDAFWDDMPTTAACGGQDRSERFKFHRSVVADGVVGAQVWVASYGDEPFAGVAVWYPPGTSLQATQAQRDAGFNQWAATWSPELSTWWSKFVPLYDAFTESAFGKEVKEDSWALLSLGVRTHLKRCGIGRALVNAGVEQAASKGKLSTLETERPDQVTVYERLGWKKMAEGRIPVELHPFNLIVMSKDP